ncbi:hypothetical protein FACS1894207_3230 [Bacteroidia bacterium]|nr:hypothetical protein FACS1894207_3230 [Bacteroidia bacterium]
MGYKIITEEDFWICTEGAIPTQFQGTRETLHNLEGKKYITKEDKSTVGWLDFGCKKYMWLVALIAAVAVVAAVAIGVLTVATGGVGLILLGAVAGLVGGAIGAVIGGLLCGQKMAPGREWLDCKNDMILQGTPIITGEHVMQCKAGGIIRYAPNIKSWLGAIGYATLSYGSELVKCAFIGAAVGTVGTLLGVGAAAVPGIGGGTIGSGVNFAGRAMTIAKPTVGSVLSNIGASFGIGTGASGATIALGSRLLFGGDSAAYTYATGDIDKNGNEAGVLDEFAKGALPEYEFASRISEKGLSGLQPSDALFLLYFLNIKTDPPGTFRDSRGTLRNARGNPGGKQPGSIAKDPRAQSAKPQNGKSYEDGNGKAWKEHEAKVQSDMKSKYENSGSQITLDVEGIDAQGNLFKETIRVDELSWNPKTKKYIITDAKHSQTKDLTRSKLDGTFTESQKPSYDAIGNGRASSITPRGDNAKKMKLSTGQAIEVENSINVGVNNNDGGITYRKYP